MIFRRGYVADGGGEDTALKKYKAAMSNGRGRIFEKMIEGGARYYKDQGRAIIVKMPEPFRVLKKDRNGIADIRFIARAQPDFIGCLNGGRTIVFEAKHTDKDRLHARALTPTQTAALEEYHNRGAVAAVCVGIGNQSFMIPWNLFRHMKERFGRHYITAEDVIEYRVKANMVVLFLDYDNSHMGSLADEPPKTRREYW